MLLTKLCLYLPVAIDDEFITILNLVDAGVRNMKTTLSTYEEMGEGMREGEKNDRLEIIRNLGDALKLVRQDFNRQTKAFEMGGGFR